MALPFTAAEFFAVFARYNAAIWPAHVAAYVLGLAALVAAWRGGRRSTELVTVTLAVFWATAGGAYHLGFFRSINPVAAVAGVLFLVEAGLLALAGVRGWLAFGAPRGVSSAVGVCFCAYSMVLYPALNVAAGHALAASPMFGVTPCPVTIYTFGLLLLARTRVPRVLLVVPCLWSLVGVVAAWQLRVPADYGLGVAGVAGTSMLVAANRRRARPAEAPARG